MTPVVVDGVMYVTVGERGVRARCAQRPRDLALQPPAHARAWPATRPAGSIAASRCSATACSWSPTTRTCSRCTASPASCSGTSRWPTRARTTVSTGAPLVVNDLVIAGVSGGDEGVRGFLDAYKASTGERVWRFWTIPGARASRARRRGVGRAIEHGCGATWLTGTYDPEARLLYWPTGNPCPDYNGDERKGDNLYTASVRGARSGDRQAEMALPVHAARSARLGRDRNAGAGGRRRFAGSRASCCCRAIATASSTCWTG